MPIPEDIYLFLTSGGFISYLSSLKHSESTSQVAIPTFKYMYVCICVNMSHLYILVL